MQCIPELTADCGAQAALRADSRGSAALVPEKKQQERTQGSSASIPSGASEVK